MGIRWKSNYLFVIWLVLFAFGLKGVFFIGDHSNKYVNKNYYETDFFENHFSQFVDTINLLELNGVTAEDAKKKLVVTSEEIEEYRYRYGGLSEQIQNIKDQYESRISDTNMAGNKESVEAYTKERDRKIADITKNFNSDEYVEAKIRQEKEQQIDRYFQELQHNYRNELNEYKDVFKYYLKDTSTGKVFTNVNINESDHLDTIFTSKSMSYVRTFPSSKFGYLKPGSYDSELESLSGIPGIGADHRFEGKIAVSKSAPRSNPVILDYKNYQTDKVYFYTILGLTALAIFFCVYFYRKIRPFQRMAEVKWLTYYERIPLDLRIVIFGITLKFAVPTLAFNTKPGGYSNVMDWVIDVFVLFSITIFMIVLVMLQAVKLINTYKKGSNHLKAEWERSILFHLFKALQQSFLYSSVGIQSMIILFVIFTCGFAFAAVIWQPRLIIGYIFGLLFVGLPTVWYIFIQIGYFNRIAKHTHELVNGNMNGDIQVKGKSVLTGLARDINVMKQGVKSSKTEQAKSERLKTELITNVSHDLRTPLTSIITYSELLKNPNLTDEDRNAYIEIVNRKSKRLQGLIEDLFEASKMASGSINLNKEQADIVQLLQQALAEHDEAIKNSTLQFRVNCPDYPVYAVVDGQKIWRVFDNLIGNTLKYSMEHTRVYIFVEKMNNQVVITFKNVTKYELGDSVDEMFERFKRGDTSRHTEGSGLGLAIAKSIMDMHGGDLDLEIDGDLFKVTVKINTM
ncbi:histidine kinase dimerization/phospho-acceptor domain-containing protein [Peribacillus loiseleuriae]|uniref:histidine kinase dimerization/phospho-acceptor domain-containing protein n=1 Tax=Peribacillus loiseleuriae TaxID=1679170 RepID=UPI003806E3B6